MIYNFLDNYKNIPNKPGIYKISTCINERFYIGSSKSIKIRMNDHKNKLKIFNHPNQRLNNFVKKYGIENFKIEIIEYCEENELLAREQHYLDIYSPYYNIRKVCESNKGVKYSDESKRKITESRLGVKNPLAKLTEEDVREIRRSSLKYRELAEVYKISMSQIYSAKHYKSYTNVK